LNQKTDENNLKYLKWLQSLYKKIYFTTDEKPLIKIKVRSKCKVSDYQAIYKQLKNNLFTCINPECKSIIYISDEHKDLFKKIGNLKLEDYSYEYRKISGHDKIRCPLCLKYKCKYCNKLSAIKISYCCPFQAFKACYNKDANYYDWLYCLPMHSPLVRVWFFGYMFYFPLYKYLTRPDKLLQSKKEIRRRRETMDIFNAYGLYTLKNESNFKIFYTIRLIGSIFWTFAYSIFFEEVLIIFMLFSLIINKDYFRRFYDCFYNMCFYPFY
jgi:hypothetical protein